MKRKIDGLHGKIAHHLQCQSQYTVERCTTAANEHQMSGVLILRIKYFSMRQIKKKISFSAVAHAWRQFRYIVRLFLFSISYHQFFAVRFHRQFHSLRHYYAIFVIEPPISFGFPLCCVSNDCSNRYEAVVTESKPFYSNRAEIRLQIQVLDCVRRQYKILLRRITC